MKAGRCRAAGWTGVLVLAVLGSAAGLANAACRDEVEPNESPDQLVDVLGGELCVKGAAAGNQDLVLWGLPEAESAALWRFRLEALPGQSGTLVLGLDQPGTGMKVLWQAPLPAETSTVVSPELLLEPGRWVLGIAAAGPALNWRLYIERAGPLPGPLATGVMEGALEGMLLGTGEPLTIPWKAPTGPGQLWDIAIQPRLGNPVGVDLQAADGTSLASSQVAEPSGGLTLWDLDPGDQTWNLVLRGLAAGQPLRLSVKPAGPREAGFAAEPDETEDRFHQLQPGQTLQGRLRGGTLWQDRDRFALVVPSQETASRFELILHASGGQSLSLQLGDPDGSSLMERQGRTEVRLSRLSLPAGRYPVAVTGVIDGDAAYTLELKEQEPASPDEEIEPNDGETHATRFQESQQLKGAFDESDRDYLKLVIPQGLQTWSFEAQGEDLQRLILFDSTGAQAMYANRGPSGPLRLARLLLPPGEHLLRLEGSRGTWSLKATAQGAPGQGDEIEPNDNPADSMALSFETPNRFWLDHEGDSDRYTFYLGARHRVRLELALPAEVKWAEAFLNWGDFRGDGPRLAPEPDAQGIPRAVWEGELGAGDHFLWIRTNSGSSPEACTLTASLAPPFSVAPSPSPPVVQLAWAGGPLAAYQRQAQRLEGRLSIRNPGTTPQELTLQAWTGDERWQVQGLPGKLQLDAGQEKDLPLQLEIAPEARDDLPSLTAVAVLQGGAVTALATAPVQVRLGIAAVNPLDPSDRPGPLAHGLNVAWTELGATAEDRLAPLVDGLADGIGVSLPLDQPLDFDLMGDQPIPVRGFVLLPPASGLPVQRLKRFALELSEEGTQFRRVLEGTVSSLSREQAFALPDTILARKARLIALEAWGGAQTPEATLSELKVVAKPGWSVPAFDLARPELGGHLVWTNPQTVDAVTGESGIWPGAKPIPFQEGGRGAQWVMGFFSSRSASIDSVTVHFGPVTGGADAIRVLELSASTEGALGPWTTLGRLEPGPEPDRIATLTFPQPVQASALRFTVVQATGDHITLPLKIQVLEHPSGSEYHSILGEGPSGTEVACSGAGTPPVTGHAGKGRDTAPPLPPDTQAVGRVGRAGDWYRLDLPADARTLKIDLGGFPTLDVAVALEDSQGQPVALTSASREAYTATVQGGPHFLKVWQPDRSAVAAWDTSMSLGNHVPTIVRVVRRLVADVEVGQAQLNFVPFRTEGSKPLLDSFAGDRAGAWTGLQAYRWNDLGSDAEQALISSTKALATRQGPRFIVLITDASSPGALQNADLWKLLQQVRPRIFTLHIPTGERGARGRAQTALMQDWAASSCGDYTRFGSPGEVDIAFRRIAAQLLEPAAYTLRYTAQNQPVQPGRLVVQAAPAASAEASAPVKRPPSGSIALILDASGSMLARIDGRPKIQIAQQMLTRLVRDVLPPGQPLALRVFGQGGEGSCRSDLVLGLAPLDVPAVVQAIEAIRSTNGAKTAIAESIRQAAQDLAAAKGAKLLVLVTDGEETCDGDPELEIIQLRAAGFDVRVNIVGFQVDDPAVRRQFQQWAGLGGGQYFDAADLQSLGSALQTAVQPAFQVLREDGKTLARGTVGGSPLLLTPGRYRVRIDTDPPLDFESVEILPDQTTTLNPVP